MGRGRTDWLTPAKRSTNKDVRASQPWGLSVSSLQILLELWQSPKPYLRPFCFFNESHCVCTCAVAGWLHYNRLIAMLLLKHLMLLFVGHENLFNIFRGNNNLCDYIDIGTNCRKRFLFKYLSIVWSSGSSDSLKVKFGPLLRIVCRPDVIESQIRSQWCYTFAEELFVLSRGACGLQSVVLTWIEWRHRLYFQWHAVRVCARALIKMRSSSSSYLGA